MGIISKTLSKKSVWGLHQVMVRLTINRNNRPRFKSGIFVHPENFADGEMIIPKKSKFNREQVRTAMEEKSQVDGFCKKLEDIVRVSIGRNRDISKEWILSVLDYEEKGLIKAQDGALTYEAIEAAFRYMSAMAQNKSCVEFKQYMTIFDFIDEYCKNKRLSRSRVKTYISAKRILFRFIMFEQMVENRENFCFELETMSAKDFEELRSYIMNEGNLLKQFPLIYEKIVVDQEEFLPRKVKVERFYGISNKSENYAIGVLKKLHALFRWLRDHKNIVHNNPFAGFEIGLPRYVRRPIYLTIQERNMLAEFDLSSFPCLSSQRDIFIFQCLVGCRYGDLITLTSANISNGVLEYVPQKTRKGRMPAQPRVPLAKKALELIEKYRGVDPKGRLFPFISITHYNNNLKAIFAMVGLDRNVMVYDPKLDKEIPKKLCDVVSSHMARRTFVGNSYKMTKDPSIVCTMSGHVEGSRAFSRYRDIDDDDLREVIDKIEL